MIYAFWNDTEPLALWQLITVGLLLLISFEKSVQVNLVNLP